MDANLAAALQISLIGMTFVLAALALLWGVIALLVRVTAERVAVAPDPSDEAGRLEASAGQALRQRAAAVAVAVALALQTAEPPAGPGTAPPARPAPPLSPWQAARRTQLLKQRERHR